MNRFRLNLQNFSDDKAEGAEGQEPKLDEAKEIKPEEPKEKLFTQEELDKIVKDRLAREKAKQEEEQKEAARLAALTEQERTQELIKLKDQEIKAKEDQIRLMELKEDTTKLLSEEGIDIKFLNFLMSDNAEGTKANVETFKAIYNATVQAEVEKRIAGPTPRTTTTKLEEKDNNDLLDKMRQARIIQN